jgi:nucleotide-binding universal stress UspA family protein
MKAKSGARSKADGFRPQGTPTAPFVAHRPAELSLKHILVPVDFSLSSIRALEYAMEFARQFGARLTLLHVVEPALYPDSHLKAPVAEETNQNLLQAARERLEEFRVDKVREIVPAETLVRMGRAYSEIPDTAKALGADLVVVGTSGHPGLKQVVMGSTAERVVRNAPCPVLTVRGGTD